MTEQSTADVQRALAAPLGFKWRLKSVTNKAKKPYPEGTKGQFLAYIDARDVFNRLDDVLGLANWQSVVKQINADGSAVVSLAIRVGGEWITREDVGYPNNPGEGVESEPLKAAVSDAVKRAAIHFGIGRFLYEMPAQWVQINERGDPLRPLSGQAPAAHREHVDQATGEIRTQAPAADGGARARQVEAQARHDFEHATDVDEKIAAGAVAVAAREVAKIMAPPTPGGNAERVEAGMAAEERKRRAKALGDLSKRRGVNFVILGRYAVEKVGKPLETCDAAELGRLITALQNETDIPGLIDYFANPPGEHAPLLTSDAADRTPVNFR